jgi:hypothetical protein
MTKIAGKTTREKPEEKIFFRGYRKYIEMRKEFSIVTILRGVARNLRVFRARVFFTPWEHNFWWICSYDRFLTHVRCCERLPDRYVHMHIYQNNFFSSDSSLILDFNITWKSPLKNNPIPSLQHTHSTDLSLIQYSLTQRTYIYYIFVQVR